MQPLVVSCPRPWTHRGAWATTLLLPSVGPPQAGVPPLSACPSPMLSLSLAPLLPIFPLSLCFRATISVAMATAAQLSQCLGPQPTELASGDRPAAPVIGRFVGKQGLEMI